MTTTDKPKRQGSRNPKGALHPMALLTETAVRNIRHELPTGASRVALAQAYSVTPRTIRAVQERQTWAHVE